MGGDPQVLMMNWIQRAIPDVWRGSSHCKLLDACMSTDPTSYLMLVLTLTALCCSIRMLAISAGTAIIAATMLTKSAVTGSGTMFCCTVLKLDAVQLVQGYPTGHKKSVAAAHSMQVGFHDEDDLPWAPRDYLDSSNDAYQESYLLICSQSLV